MNLVIREWLIICCSSLPIFHISSILVQVPNRCSPNIQLVPSFGGHDELGRMLLSCLLMTACYGAVLGQGLVRSNEREDDDEVRIRLLSFLQRM